MKEINNPAQNKIMEIIHKLVENNIEISQFKCPERITSNLLKEAMFGPYWEKEKEFSNCDKHTAWYAFSSVFYNKNPFGFQIDKMVSPNIKRSPNTFSNIGKDVKSKSIKSQNKKSSSESPSFEAIDKPIPFFEFIE